MPKKAIQIFLILASILAFIFFLQRDLELESHYTYDLRNRLVGARIQKDGGFPYLFNWTEKDSLRYYDAHMYGSFNVSRITASPFFHHLLYPIADLPHKTFSLIWLGLEYLMIVLSVILAFSFTSNLKQKAAVVSCAILMMSTYAWTHHISAGQNYLIIPFFFMLFVYFISRPQKFPNGILAGLFAISVLLIRPNTLFFFLPFLFVIKRFPLRYLVAFFLPALILLSFILLNKHELALWKNYQEGAALHLRVHEMNGKGFYISDSIPRFAANEGWDTAIIINDIKIKNITNSSENGNIFFIIELMTGIRLSTTVLFLLTILIAGGILTFFYRKNIAGDFSILQVAILGSCLYMISDFMSPIFRHQYYTVQWLAPMLLACASFEKKQQKWILIALAGLALNIISSPFLKMEHTIGEFIMLFALTIYCFQFPAKSAL